MAARRGNLGLSKKETLLSTITLLNHTITVLSKVTENLPIRMNLGLLRFLWMPAMTIPL